VLSLAIVFLLSLATAVSLFSLATAVCVLSLGTAVYVLSLVTVELSLAMAVSVESRYGCLCGVWLRLSMC